MAIENIFGAPPEYLSGLLGVDPEKLRKQALTTGLVNTALAFAAQPRNQNYGSVLPYAARALMAGQQGAQGVYQGALQDFQTRQKIEELKRQQEQQQAQQQYVNQFATERPELASAIKAYPELIPDIVKQSITPPENTKFGLSPRIAINPATQTPEYVQFNERGEYKFTGIRPTQDEIAIAKAIDEGILPEGYVGRPPQATTQRPANGLPTNNFNLPYDITFGAPGTTATDIAEGVTGESSIQLGDPSRPQTTLPKKSQRELELARQKATILTPKEEAEISKMEREQAESESKSLEKAQYKQTIGNVVIKKIDDVIKRVDRTSAGIGGSMLRRIPGTDAYDMSADIDTIKANFGFDRLQAMRDMSPTGGALGQVAVQELSMLQASVANLDPSQSPSQLKKNLQQAKKHYENWLKTIDKSNNIISRDEKMPQKRPTSKNKLFDEADAIIRGR